MSRCIIGGICECKYAFERFVLLLIFFYAPSQSEIQCALAEEGLNESIQPKIAEGVYMVLIDIVKYKSL